MTLARTSLIETSCQDQGRAGETAIARARFAAIIAFLLAALHAVLAITAAIEKSPTFDEPTHLTAGYSYWLKNDYRLDPENGNLPARWAAIPLLWSRPVFPENAAWDRGDVGRVSENFLYRCGNDSDGVMLQGRSMMVIVGAGLCLLIFFCSARLFGPVGGLISELLAVFDPNLLAHYCRCLELLSTPHRGKRPLVFDYSLELVWPLPGQDVGAGISLRCRDFGGCSALRARSTGSSNLGR
jgi:hypothetical protein